MLKSHPGAILIDETCGLEFTESPRWHDGKFWFVDIHDKRIKTTDHLLVACGTRRLLGSDTCRLNSASLTGR
jgi:hypothetical protein